VRDQVSHPNKNRQTLRFSRISVCV